MGATISFDKVLQPDDWNKKGGAEHEKRTHIGAQLGDLGKAFKKIDQDLFEVGKFKSVDEVDDRIAALEAEVKKGDMAETIEAAETLIGTLKKFSPEFAKNPQTAKTLAPLATAITKAAQTLCQDLRKAAEAAEAALDKAREAVEKAEAEAAKKEDPAAKLAKLKAYNQRVKQLIGTVNAGKVPGLNYGFGFVQANKNVPYAKGKPWSEKSLLAVGPRAGKSSRSDLALKRGDEEFKFFYGRLRKETAEGKDKGKLIFEFESPLPNAKQFRDALMFQCGYVPKLQLRKAGSKEVVDDEGEGKETDEPGDDNQAPAVGKADPRGAALQARFKELKAAMDRVRAQGGPLAAAMDKADEQFAALLQHEQFADAEKVLTALRDKIGGSGSGGSSAAAPAGAAAPDPRQDPAVQRIVALRSAWATVRSDAVEGIEQLVRTIEKEYRDEVEQRDQVDKATKKLRTLAGQLKDDLEKQLDLVVKAPDAGARSNQMRAAKTRLTEVLRVVAADPLMKELDGNELMPDLKIVKPMQDRLREIAAALG